MSNSASRLALLGLLAIAGHAAAAPTDRAIWRAEALGKNLPAPTHPPGYYGIGTTPTPAAITGWSIAVTPDGAGLPSGSGTATQGEALYASHCASCHGSFGEGAHGYPALAGGVGSLASASPQKTANSYFPYATSLWDYIDRAMPFYAPHSLTPDQVYALTAYILNLDGITPDAFIANATSLPQVNMPNRHGFIWRDPRPLTHNKACMNDCASASSIKVTSDAATTSLTPRLTGPVDHMKSGRQGRGGTTP